MFNDCIETSPWLLRGIYIGCPHFCTYFEVMGLHWIMCDCQMTVVPFMLIGNRSSKLVFELLMCEKPLCCGYSNYTFECSILTLDYHTFPIDFYIEIYVYGFLFRFFSLCYIKSVSMSKYFMYSPSIIRAKFWLCTPCARNCCQTSTPHS